MFFSDEYLMVVENEETIPIKEKIDIIQQFRLNELFKNKKSFIKSSF